MVSKCLVIFVVASQIGQWIFIGSWLMSRDNVSNDEFILPTQLANTASSSEATLVVPVTCPSPAQVQETRPVPRKDRIDSADIDRYLDFNQNQSLERYRINTFAPTNADLFYSYLPQIWCSSMVRVGGLDDGGKWLCNPWYLKRPHEPCLVYSIGVGFNLKFDRELMKNYGCRIYAFDPDPMARRTVERMDMEEIQFYPWAVVGSAGRRSPMQKSIGDVLIQFNHRRLDVLKIDVEGGEFDLIETFLTNDQPLIPVCQILIEVHTWDVTKWRRMFRQLERAGFLVFSREVNILGFGDKLEKIAIEYSYIHKECLKRFGLDRVPRIRNFPSDDYTFEPVTPRLLP